MTARPFRTLLALGAFALLIPGAMHLRLTKSMPADGEILTDRPVEVRLWFNQKPDVGLTTIRLLREDSTRIEIGKVEKTSDSLSVTAPLDVALVPGTYIVAWRSVSKDGHPVRGSYDFNVSPGPPARKQEGK